MEITIIGIIVYEVLVGLLIWAYLSKRIEKIDKYVVVMVLCAAIPIVPVTTVFTAMGGIINFFHEHYDLKSPPPTIEFCLGDTKFVWTKKSDVPQKPDMAPNKMLDAQLATIITQDNKADGNYLQSISIELQKLPPLISKIESHLANGKRAISQPIAPSRSLDKRLSDIQTNLSQIKSNIRKLSDREISVVQIQAGPGLLKKK